MSLLGHLAVLSFDAEDHATAHLLNLAAIQFSGFGSPPGRIQELRDLTRTRKQLIREIGQHKQRIQKVLEDANVKLASVVSDLFGESGRRMLKALSASVTDPVQLAALRDGRLTASPEALAEALHEAKSRRIIGFC